MPTTRESILRALLAALQTMPDATVLREEVLPERLPLGGLVILRDGHPGTPEVTLPEDEFEAMLARAAEQGARRALADVGLDGPERKVSGSHDLLATAFWMQIWSRTARAILSICGATSGLPTVATSLRRIFRSGGVVEND